MNIHVKIGCDQEEFYPEGPTKFTLLLKACAISQLYNVVYKLLRRKKKVRS